MRGKSDRSPLEYEAPTTGPRRGRPSPTAWSVIGAVDVLVNSGATTCTCGHMDGLSLVGNTLGSGVVCFGLLTQKAGLLRKLVIYLCFAFACMVMIQNAHNMLCPDPPIRQWPTRVLAPI